MFSRNKLSMISTDLRDPELLLLKLVEEERKQTPERFSGENGLLPVK